MQDIFKIITFWDEVMIVLHKFDSDSELIFFTLQVIFGHFLHIVSCDICLVLAEHLTYSLVCSWSAVIY